MKHLPITTNPPREAVAVVLGIDPRRVEQLSNGQAQPARVRAQPIEVVDFYPASQPKGQPE